MPRIHRIATGIVTVWLVAGAAGTTAEVRLSAQIWPADERAAVADFTRRAQAYVDLRRAIEGPTPTVAVSADPAEIRQAMDRLGDAIRLARAGAHQGDIFTPDVSAILRRSIAKSCGGAFRALFDTVHEGEPPMPPAGVNGRWPAERYPFTPPDLLRALPPLSDELVFLFVNRDLVLWDRYADVVIDILPNAIPRETT